MFVLLDLVVLGFVILVMFFIVTQVFQPAIRGTHLFPMFRRNKVAVAIKETEKALEDLADVQQLKETVDEYNRRKAEMEKK
jgi:hypothetical protein